MDDNFSKYQWIFTKLGMCIDIVKIWFGIPIGQILSILTELSAHDKFVFLFQDNNLSKSLWIFTKLDMLLLYYEDLVWDCYWVHFVNY